MGRGPSVPTIDPGTNRLTLAAFARQGRLLVSHPSVYGLSISRIMSASQARVKPEGIPGLKDDAAPPEIQIHCRLRMAHV